MTAQIIDRRSVPSHAVESVWRAEDGHPIRRIDLKHTDTAADVKGSILFFPGRGDAYEKYLESLQQWYDAGWNVTGADWRGQAGSGRLGDDAVTGHIEDFSIWVDDLTAFWSDWVAQTSGPHVLAGHSMGGHIILRGLVEQRVKPDAMFLSAPMLGYFGNILPRPVMHAVAKLIKRFRGDTTQAWVWSEKPGEVPIGRINLLTHDKDRYEDELWWREQRPELIMGPGSWGWVERGYASMDVIFAPNRLEAVSVPVLMVATTNDKLVDHRAIVEATDRLPNGELLEFGKEASHEILREVDSVRDRAMNGIAEFLTRVLPTK